VVGADAVEVLLVIAAADQAPVYALGTVLLERARVAGRRVSLIEE
jgi:hypothetical protein